MRKITLIVLHCSAVRPNQTSSADQIDSWHKSRGWKGIGYHFVVRRDGSIENGRPIEEPGAHVASHNKYSIGVCYEGGLNAAGNPADTRTPEQVRALRELVERLHERFPNAVIVGHHDLNHGKDCPCFNAVSEYAELQPGMTS